MSKNFEKIRKLNGLELVYDAAVHKFNFMICCYWLRLDTRQPLNPDHVAQALKLLFRYTDNLSLCIRGIDENRWFCRMAEEKIEFEVLRNRSPKDIMEEEILKKFNTEEGPLWRSKLVFENGETVGSTTNEMDGNCNYNILFTFHHAIMDGFTTFHMCNHFLRILNDVIGGRVKEPYEGFGVFSDGRETDRLLQERRQYFEKNLKSLERIQSEMAAIAEQNILIETLFPVSGNTQKKTKHITRDMDEEYTAKFINKLKEKGISFHAGFTAIANWALFEILSENDHSLDSVDIGAFHALNMRRYWKDNSSIYQGCHIGSLRMFIKTDKSLSLNFWNYAREVHHKLKHYISNCRSLDEVLAYPCISKFGRTNNVEDVFKYPPPLQLYYSTSNMGEVTSFFNSKRDHVDIKWLTRTVSAHNMNISMSHVIQTFRGRFLYGLSYSTNYIREDLAYNYVDTIFEKIYRIIEM